MEEIKNNLSYQLLQKEKYLKKQVLLYFFLKLKEK